MFFCTQNLIIGEKTHILQTYFDESTILTSWLGLDIMWVERGLTTLIAKKRMEEPDLKIAVIGAGAMGSLYGGYLSKENDVTLVDIWQQHVDAINNTGLIIEEGFGSVNTYNPKATSDPTTVGKVDLVVLFVKSIQTADALAKNKALIGPNTIMLSLQNGYGNADDMLKYVPQSQVLVGTTSDGSTLMGTGHISHKGKGHTYVGALSDDQTQAEKVVQILRGAGFDAEVSNNVIDLVWRKLFINIALNPITAILDALNGYVNDNEHAQNAAKLAVYEAVDIANADGMNFDHNKVFNSVLEVACSTAKNRSSMLTDVTNKRETEIDKINGAVVSKAAELGLNTPVNALLINLVKAKGVL